MGISIIVTAFNIEEYIGRCLESIINQTYTNIEIIVVDDGSVDNTENEINKYIHDKRIKYIKIKNSGVSVARNVGLDLATKEYLMFVDGDDYIDELCVEESIKELKRDNSDILVFDIITKDQDDNILCESAINVNEKKLNNIEYCKCIFLKKINAGVTNKIINTNIIKKNKIRFKKQIHMGEDLLFNINVLVVCKKITMCNGKFYNYIRRSSSATLKVDFKHFSIVDSLNYVKKNLLHNNIYYYVKEEYEIFRFFMLFEDRILKYSEQDYNKYFYNTYKDEINTITKNIYFNQVSSISKIFVNLYKINFKLGFYNLLIAKIIKKKLR